MVLDIAGESSLDANSVSGVVTDIFTSGLGIIIGNEDCGRYNWNFDDGSATDVRFGVFDLAGNFSGWTEPQDVDPGCGSRVGPGTRQSSSGFFGLLAVVLVVVVERRKALRLTIKVLVVRNRERH